MAGAKVVPTAEAGWNLANPWRWMLVGVGASGLAFLQARFVGADWPALRGGLIVGGLLAAAGALCLRFQGATRPPDAEEPVRERTRAAALLILAALTAFLACWALYLGPDHSEDWDSIRLLLAVVALVAFVAAPIVAAARWLRRLLVSVLLVVHFGGILIAVTAEQPGPWVATQFWVRFYRPYLEFMHLNNAYRFYSPEPGPSTQLWFRIEYKETNKAALPVLGGSTAGLLGAPLAQGPLLAAAAVFPGRGETLHSHWIKLPDVDADGVPQYPLRLQYQRRLSLTENVTRTGPVQLPEHLDQLGNKVWERYAIRRDLQAPKPLVEKNALGEKQPRHALSIPYHPTTHRGQYGLPNQSSKLFLQSYARYVARLPHPKHADAKAVSVKIYRVLHETLTAPDLAAGADPQDLRYFLPYYQGQYDPAGRLLDPDDPFLYWLLPTLPGDWTDPKNPRAGLNQPLSVFAFLHAGDKDKWIVPSVAAPKE